MQQKYSRLVMVGLFLLLLQACAGKPKVQPLALPEPKPEQLQAPILSPDQLARYQMAIDKLSQNKLNEAEQLLAALLLEVPRLAGASVNLGLIAQQREDQSSAETYFEQALEANPYQTQALIATAQIYQDNGEFRLAEANLKRALEKKPDNALAHYNLGVLYELYLREYGLAVQHYGRYVELAKGGEDIETVKRWMKLLERKL